MIFDQFHYGVCHYPEHEPLERLASDIARIARAGFSFVRIGEGAWGYFEPEEGQFQFELFDKVIAQCKRHDIKVIFGTPTYCAPAWVSEKYPETLRWNFSRIPMGHGSRRNFNYTSPKYLELSDKICTALAEHYKKKKQIIGWQLDNEFNCHMDVSYAPSDEAAFRVWLKNKYGKIEKLNEAWGTLFWSQQYGSFDEVHLPQPTATYLNPHALLDESRFISDCVVAFAARQAAILRKANPRWLITHNGVFSNVNGPDLVEKGKLNFFSHDQYPAFVPEWGYASSWLIRARSLSFPYAILEQQAGPGGQMIYLHATPRPGQIRLWAWQSIAHGAKMLSYFRWRTCAYGSEQHWHGLIDADDVEGRRLAEARQMGVELAKLPKAVFDAPVVRKAVVLRDYDNEVNEKRINTYVGEAKEEHERWAMELARRQIPVDYVWRDGNKLNLSGYSLIVAPHLKMIDKQTVESLLQAVQRGATLVIGAQSGTKNEHLHIVSQQAPGIWRKHIGVEVEDWSSLPRGEVRNAKMADGRTVPLIAFAEKLKTTARGTTVLASHDAGDPLFAGGAAITRTPCGKGAIVYVGGYLGGEGVEALADEVLDAVGLTGLVDATANVEAIARDAGKKKYLFLMNHGAKAEEVRGLPEKSRDLIAGAVLPARTITLPPYGVAVLEHH